MDRKRFLTIVLPRTIFRKYSAGHVHYNVRVVMVIVVAVGVDVDVDSEQPQDGVLDADHPREPGLESTSVKRKKTRGEG